MIRDEGGIWGSTELGEREDKKSQLRNDHFI